MHQHAEPSILNQGPANGGSFFCLPNEAGQPRVCHIAAGVWRSFVRFGGHLKSNFTNEFKPSKVKSVGLTHKFSNQHLISLPFRATWILSLGDDPN